MAETYLKIKRNSHWNEWVVVWIENGKRNEAKTYRTHSFEDAVQTAIDTAIQHDLKIHSNSQRILEYVDNLL